MTNTFPAGPDRRAAKRALAQCRQGHISAARGRFEDALTAYAAAVQLDAGLHEAIAGRGAMLLRLGRAREALADLEHARSGLPEDAVIRFNLANALRELGEVEPALASYDAALQLDPAFAAAHNNRGDLLKELGRLDAAAAAFDSALAIAPADATYFFNLTSVRALDPGHPAIAAVEARLARPVRLSADTAARLHYGLGKALADGGAAERSFAQFQAGARAKRAAVVYDEAAVMDCFDQVEAIFSRAFIEQRRGSGDPSPAPIFVFGMPRSGTTLVEQILASHPDVHGAGETPHVAQATDCLAYLLRARNAGPFPGIAHAIAPRDWATLGQLYLQLVGPIATAARRFVDKQLTNFFFLGMIHLALPNARLVHVARDPLDTCFSCFTTLFTEGQHFTYDLGELGRFYRRYHRLMRHWRAVLPAVTLLDLVYEDVVADTEGSARRLLAHCDLAWDAACLRFYTNARPVRTASAAQVRRPIYRTAIGRWQAHEAALGPLIAELATLDK